MPTDPKQRAITVKNRDIIEVSVAYWKRAKNRLQTLKTNLERKQLAPKTLFQKTVQTTITTTTKTVTELKESQKLFTHLVRHVRRQSTPERNATMEPMHAIDHLLGTGDRKHKIGFKTEPIKVIQLKLPKLQTKIQTKNSTSSLRSCDWQSGDY